LRRGLIFRPDRYFSAAQPFCCRDRVTIRRLDVQIATLPPLKNLSANYWLAAKGTPVSRRAMNRGACYVTFVPDLGHSQGHCDMGLRNSASPEKKFVGRLNLITLFSKIFRRT